MDDTISRREVIDYLNCLLDGRFSKDKEAMIEGIRDNIMMLPNKSVRVHSAQPKTDGDAISRAAAIDILYNFAGCIVDTPNGDYCKAFKKYKYELENLPSAQPERKTGRCEYCETDSDDFVRPLEKNSHAFISYGMNGAELIVKANGWRGNVKINYCPICGRHLRKRKDGEG